MATSDRTMFSQVVMFLVALLCGTGVWLVVQLTETSEVTLGIDVIPTGVDPEVELGIEPRQVQVRFSFPASESLKMRSDNFFLEVDFSDLKQRIGRRLEDSGDRTLSREMVRNIVDAASLNIQPVDLLTPQVTWEARLRHAPAVIRPVVIGQPASGYTYDPDSSVIDGSGELIVLLTEGHERSFLASEAEFIELETTPLDVSGLSGLVRDQVEVIFPEGMSPLPGEENATRTVVVDIVEETVTRRIEDVPVRYEFVYAGEDLQAELSPAEVAVIVTGRASAVRQLTPDMISFSLFGVSEQPGESREVALETRILDAGLRPLVDRIETDPQTVLVRILSTNGDEDGEAEEEPGTP